MSRQSTLPPEARAVYRKIERQLERKARRLRKRRRRKLDPDIVAQIPSLQSVCEGAGFSHWRISRSLGPGGWQLLYLRFIQHRPFTQLGELYGVAPSMVFKRVRRLKERLRRVGLTMPAYLPPARRRCFTDCAGRERTHLLQMVAYFDRFPPARKNGKPS